MRRIQRYFILLCTIPVPLFLYISYNPRLCCSAESESNKRWFFIDSMNSLALQFYVHKDSSERVEVNVLPQTNVNKSFQINHKTAKKTVQRMCNRHKRIPHSLKSLTKKQRRITLNHLIVNDEYKFIYCYTPKVKMTENQGGYGAQPPAYQQTEGEKFGPPPDVNQAPPPQGYQNQPGLGGHPMQPGQPGYPGQPGGYAPPPQQGGVVPPPPPGMGYGAPGQTVIIQQQFSQAPTACQCPNCHQQVVTLTTAETGMLTWLIIGAIILFGGWIFCLCFIPLCIDDLKDIRHQCPNCQHTIHIYKRA